MKIIDIIMTLEMSISLRYSICSHPTTPDTEYVFYGAVVINNAGPVNEMLIFPHIKLPALFSFNLYK